MKNLLQKGKDLVQANRNKVRPALEFAGKCVEEIANISQLQKNPSVANYLNTAFRFRTHFKNIFKNDLQNYFLNDSWEPIFTHEVWAVVVQILERGYVNRIEVVKEERTSGKIFICNLPDNLLIGWVGNGNLVESMYISPGRAKEIKVLLEKEVWKIFKTDCLSIGLFKHNWETCFTIDQQEDHQNYVKCLGGDKYSEYIKQYQIKGIGRSVLFYGPPGTGKSNIVKSISNSLKLKTVRLQSLNEVRSRALVSLLDIFNPDAVILEDIDHLYSYDISTLLEKIENFNARGKYVLATANEVTKINSALLRPGRFDELVEIVKLDDEALKSLIGEDQELYTIVKDYPVAFVVELLKRIEVMGRKDAISNINDIKKRVEMLNKAEYRL